MTGTFDGLRSTVINNIVAGAKFIALGVAAKIVVIVQN